jgi:hypothetical protein
MVESMFGVGACGKQVAGGRATARNQLLMQRQLKNENRRLRWRLIFFRNGE